MNENEDVVWIVTAPLPVTPQVSANRGIREISEAVVRQGVPISAETLKANFENFFKTVTGLLTEIPQANLPYVIDEIEISAEISGEGKIQLIGGVTAGAKGGITFKLKRLVPDKEHSQ